MLQTVTAEAVVTVNARCKRVIVMWIHGAKNDLDNGLA